MKKIKLMVAGGALLLAALAYAAAYTGTLVNKTALAYDSTYAIDMNTVVRGGITSLSAQGVYSRATIAASTFNDGRVSTGAITVTNPADLASNVATNQITLAATPVLLAASATNYLTILSTSSISNAVISYGPNKVRQGHEWTTVATTSGTAQAITNAFNKYAGMTATRSGDVVSLSLTPGAAGNGKTLSSNVGNITVGGAAFGGGHNSRIANAVITCNGQRLRQGYEWYAAETSSGSATNLAAIMNKVTGVRASAAGSVVYSTAATYGTASNAIALTSNAPSYLTVANPTYSGGKDRAYVRINGVTLTNGVDWTSVATASGTAKAISDAILANASLNGRITASSTLGVVSITSLIAGASQNYTLVTNYPSQLTLSGANMTGGLTPAYALNSSAITVAGHGLTTALPVLYSASPAVSPLVSGTTYYSAKIDANTIALATSKSNALAGTYITLTSSSTTGPHTSTLSPLAYTGTAGFFWEGSNDGSNYNPIDISSITYSSPSGTPTTTTWDFGVVGTRYVRLNVTAPTTGGLNLAVTLNGN